LRESLRRWTDVLWRQLCHHDIEQLELRRMRQDLRGWANVLHH
jgi:hypothetical protein